MTDAALQAIKESPIFCGLRDEDLQELVDGGRRFVAEAGSCPILEGDQGDSLLIVLSGEIEVVRDVGEAEASLARFGPGAFVGEMALIDHGPRTATVRTLERSEFLEITREQFDRLLDQSPDACRALVRTILRRLKSTEAMLVNQEKLAALGRVSAGLAHELNNPASAVSRFAEQLVSTLSDWQSATVRLANSVGPEEMRHLIQAAQDAHPTSGAGSEPLSALQRAEREDELADVMDSYGVGNPWDPAANLAAGGWTADKLEALIAQSSASDPERYIHWLSTESLIQSTLSEMRTSADRLSEIVDAVKRYSHMDRAPVEQIDVNRGIETTMVILRHKLRDVTVNLDLDRDLPEITGYPAELNQVWTNLMDNAIDAMGGNGTLEIRTAMQDNDIVVSLTDSGAGISQQHMGRLFEPFFTTKAVGVGTGLGLHIAHNIVVQRHGGNISVDSRPGRTTFTVTLPVKR